MRTLKVLIIGLLLCGQSYAQFTKYPYPIMSSPDSSFIWTPYTSANFENGTFVMFYRNLTSGISYRCKLGGGTRRHSEKRVRGTTGQILARTSYTDWVGASERLVKGVHYVYVLTESTDFGCNWSVTGDTMSMGGNKNAGEDISAYRDPYTGRTYILFRDSTTQINPRRTLAMTSTLDWETFEKRQSLLTNGNFNNVNSKFFRKSVYQASMIKTGINDWWIFANVFQHRVDMKENNPPPYAIGDHTLETYLYYSSNGVDWKMCNDSNAIIPYSDSAKQVLGLPTITNGYIYVYTINNKRRHNGLDPEKDRFWIDLRYISTKRFMDYKPLPK